MCKIPQLVENNSTVAVVCLMQLLSSSGQGVMDYLSVLAEMGMSFHSIEVGLDIIYYSQHQFMWLGITYMRFFCLIPSGNERDLQ